MAFSFLTPSPQQQQQPQPSPFFQPQQQQQPQQSIFQNNFFNNQQQQQQQQQQFQQQQQQFQQQQQQHQQQQLYIFTNEKTPATYNTKWADLHPESQKFLLQIEERILEYRDESQRLDQCSRLYDSSVSNDGFELDASHIVQELVGISSGMERERVLLQELMAVLKDMMRNTEVAVRSFIMLRPRFVHPSVGTGSNVSTTTQAPGSAIAPNASQPTSTAVVPVYDFYTGLPRKPSPFLQQTVARFEKYLSECSQRIVELEQLLLSYPDGRSSGSESSLLQSLPKVMSNVHDFFVHVAAKVESLHQYIESMKTAYLADQRRRGDVNDPFLEADRRELAKREAAAKRVHPTLHLTSVPQPSTQVAGLHSSAPTTVTSNTPQLPSASSGSGFSLFNTPASAPSASMFSTPSVAAPTSSLFGSSAATPQSSIFGSATASLFGNSTPAFSSTPATSLFGNSTPAFSSTPATGNSLFATPFASGPTTGSGASFGTVSKASRPKSRTARR